MSYLPKHLLVEIPWPRPTSNLNRGAFLSETKETKPVSVRLNEDERKTIEAVCRRLDMTRSDFFRWCAFYAAIEVNNRMESASFTLPAHPANDPDTDGFE